MPTDPRKSNGKCAALGSNIGAYPSAYQPWQTGGTGAGTIAAGSFTQWPPTSMAGVGGLAVSLLPTYTPTGTIPTLPPAVLTPSPTGEGNGWVNAQDTLAAMTTIASCSYPNAWDSSGAVTPTAM